MTGNIIKCNLYSSLHTRDNRWEDKGFCTNCLQSFSNSYLLLTQIMVVWVVAQYRYQTDSDVSMEHAVSVFRLEVRRLMIQNLYRKDALS
jgi:hypothetical protein